MSLSRAAGLGFLAVVFLCGVGASPPAPELINAVFIADNGGVIYRYDLGTASSIPFVTNTSLAGAVGVLQETSGDLLVSTSGSRKLWRIDHVTRGLTVLSQGGFFQSPGFMAIIGSEVFVADPGEGAIIGVDTTTGVQRVVVNGGLTDGGPAICSGTDGFLYVGRSTNSTIVRVDPATGNEQLVASGGLLSGIAGMTYGKGDHFLYVSCGAARSIVKVDPANGSQVQVVQGAFDNEPYGISYGDDGYLWVGVKQTNELVRVLPANGAHTTYHVSGMTQPAGVQAGVNATPVPPAPSAPTCSATADRLDSVIVQWTAPSGQVDNYKLTRDGSTLATLDPSILRYADKPSQGMHTYCVSATNLGGTSSPCCEPGQLKPPVVQPRLDSVLDVPNDQGGKVMLGWRSSDFDVPGGSVIGYRIWRRLPVSPQAALRVAGLRELRTTTFGAQTDYWEALADLSAGRMPTYGYAAATLQDSLPGSNPFTAFFVTAVTSDPTVFYDSNVDSGYSVDNLAPDTPQGMQGTYLAGSGIKIQWLPSQAPDVAQYDIYRGLSSGFAPAAFNRIGATSDTTFVDPSAASYFYKLSAVDVHNNESGFALLKPSDIPMASLVESFTAQPTGEGVQVALQLAGAPDNFGVRLWRSGTDSRAGAVALSTDPVPIPSTGYQMLDSTAPRERLWYWADLYMAAGFTATFGPITVLPTGALPNTILLAPQPNPSTSGVDFGYTVGSDQGSAGVVPVRLMIFDTRGKLVRTLRNDSEPVGRYQVHWDGTDERGARAGTGVYQYRLQVGTQQHSGKVIRI